MRTESGNRAAAMGIVAITMVLGCGKTESDVGSSTPEALTKAALKAANEKDLNALKRLCPTKEAVAEAVACGDNDLETMWKLWDKHCNDKIGELIRSAENGPREWVGLEDVDTRGALTVEPGVKVNGSCIASKAVVLHALTIKSKQGSAEARDKIKALRLGDRWYLQEF